MLVGLMISGLLCFTLLVVLVCLAVILPLAGAGNPDDRLELLAARATFTLALLIAGTLCAGGGIILYKQAHVWQIAWTMQRELGFEYEADKVIDDQGRLRKVPVIASLRAGGPMHQAGAEAGEVIDTTGSLAEF